MPSRNRAREAAKAAARRAATDRAKTGGKSDARKNKSKGKTKKSGRNAGPNRAGESGAESNPASTGPPRRPRTGPMFDPSAADDAQTRFVQPYEATKAYICPGCNRDIPPGVGHLVAVPPNEPDLRRHWHRGCWHNRHTRF